MPLALAAGAAAKNREKASECQAAAKSYTQQKFNPKNMNANPLGDREIVIKFTSTARLLGDSECAPTFFHDWEGRIVAEGDPDLSPAPLPEIFIGSLKLMYADVEGMINAGKSLFSYFDAFD